MFSQMKDIFPDKSVYNTSKEFLDEISLFNSLFLISRNRVRQMFYHSYDSYLKYAYPYDELRPLTCDG